MQKIADQFAGATFNGMEDIKDYHTSSHNGETVRWGADFVFCNRHYTPEALQAVMEQIGVTEMAFVTHSGLAYLDSRYTNDDKRREIYAAARETSF